MDTVAQAIERSRALQKSGDLPGAIACLAALIDAEGFFPVAALHLMGLKQAARDWPGAKALADAALQHAPHAMAAWTIRLSHRLPRAKEPDLLPPRWPDFLEALRRQPDLAGRGRGLRHAVMETLLRLRPPDWPALADKALAGGVLNRPDIAALERALPFLAAIVDMAPPAGAPGLPWSIGLEPWPEPCRATSEAIRINTGWFRGIDASQGWDFAVYDVIADEIVAALGPTGFQDRVDVTAAPWIGPGDFAATLAEMALVLSLREALGLDRDVRDCIRPARFDHGSLVLRTGRCELWALTSWLIDPEAQARAAERVATRATQAARSGEPFESWGFHPPRLDPEENCNSLSCNAGWYARPGHGASAFRDWADRYLKAMDAGDLLAECAEDLQRIASLRPASADQPLHHWDDLAFAQSLSGRDVVFVTAFAPAMQQHFASGRLAALWQRAGLPAPPRSLRTVQAPMSVWPYMPDRDWSETFQRLTEVTAEAIADPKATVLLASCGSYGLPLVHDLHRRLPGLTAVYNGHPLNALFGILTNDALASRLFHRAPDPALWQVVELATLYPDLARIDEGRYVADRIEPGPPRSGQANGK